MAAYELLLLNTAIPQIQAAQSGDTYLCPRELAVVVNTATDAVRITQTGTGNALLVEDSANPDSTPFVVTATGNVGIGTNNPGVKLDVDGTVRAQIAGGGTGRYLDIGSDGSGTTRFFNNYAGGGDFGFVWRIGASDRMTLDASGNLGVGATSPQGRLEVAATGATVNQYLTGGTGNNAVTGIFRIGSGAGRGASIQGFRGVSSNAHSLDFYTYNSADVFGMRLDTSGNLGLGVTPSAWFSTSRVYQFGSGGALEGRTNESQYLALTANQYIDSAGTRKYIGSTFASLYQQYNGKHEWFTAPSGTAGNAISFTQAMTLDASGRLGVGATNPDSMVEINSATAAYARFKINYNSSALAYFGSYSGIVGSGNATDTMLSSQGVLAFGAGGTAEAARITSGGDLLVKKTSSGGSATGIDLNANGFVGSYSPDTSDSTVTYAAYSNGASAYRFYVGWGGTVFATNTTISAISDQRFKENIRDLDIGLNAILALKPRKFDWKIGKGKDKKDDRGFIAQEFEQVFPDLIDTWKDPAPEGEEPYKSVRQDLIPVLVKAIQEQQAMINELKAEVAALKGA